MYQWPRHYNRIECYGVTLWIVTDVDEDLLQIAIHVELCQLGLRIEY
jgi:hypothetical protein